MVDVDYRFLEQRGGAEGVPRLRQAPVELVLDVLAAKKKSKSGLGGDPGKGEEDGRGLGPGDVLISPETKKSSGGPVELRRRNSTALGHDSKGKERGNGEEDKGYL